MNDKILISSILTDLTLSSKIEFIEAKDNHDLIDLAKSKGIDLPSPDLACFRAIYCELDKPNLNNAMLPKKIAIDGINSLVGKQININHLGKNYIIGYTIDAKIIDDLIIVTGILFKSLFFEEFDEIKQLFEEGKLFLSFELWNREPETGESIIEVIDGGIKKITKMIAHGVGLLLKGVNPACKRAQVFKLLANQKDNGESTFQEDERFAYATLSSKEECSQCKECLCKEEDKKLEEIKVDEVKAEEIKIEEFLDNDYEGGEIEEAKKLTTEQRNALPDSDFALIQEKDGKKIRRFPINDEAHVRNALARLPLAKDITEEERKSTLAKILKKAKELNMTELLKKYEKSDEQSSQVTPEPAQVTEPAPIIEQKPEEQAQVAEAPVKEEVKSEVATEVKAEVVVEEKKEEIVEVKYTQAQLEEKVNAAKVEKDAEITTLKSEQEKVITAKDLEIKNLIETKDKEISNLKQELGKKDQEIARLNPISEPEKDKTLEVGNTIVNGEDETTKQAKKINEIIAEKHKK